MKPLPKCAGKLIRTLEVPREGVDIFAETETGLWTLIDDIWHQVTQTASMGHADRDPANDPAGSGR